MNSHLFFLSIALNILVLPLACAPAQAPNTSTPPEIITRLVLPSHSDPAIDDANIPHYIARNPSAKPRNELLLFFPGTKANPLVYRHFVHTAAELGYHAIGLSYPNHKAINALCGEGGDLDCYGNARLETLDGKDRTPIVDVSRADSIENRLVKLLIYLSKHDTEGDWGLFLDTDHQIRWPIIAVAGHSQGGGFAGIAGRYFPVARSIMFDADDYNEKTQKLANWIALPESTPNATPPNRFFAFAHYRDEFVLYSHLSAAAWPAYGITALGAPVNIDSALPPYANSHALFSNRDIHQPSILGLKFHNASVLDTVTPTGSTGAPVYKPVWIYMLTAELRE